TEQAELDDEIVDAALEATGTTHLMDRDITVLSGGERARVAMARVLAQRTPVVLFDEPTAAMDIRYQEQSLGLIRELALHGATVIVVLHDLNAAAAYCDSIVCLDQGRLAALGDVDTVFTTAISSAVYGCQTAGSKTRPVALFAPDRPAPGAFHNALTIPTAWMDSGSPVKK